MAIEDRFGEFADETRALQRAITWLQEHDRNTPSEEAAEEALGTNVPSRDERELRAHQEERAQLQFTRAAIERLQQHVDKMRAEQPGSPNTNPPDPNADNPNEHEDLAEIEDIEIRAARRASAASLINSRRIRKQSEIRDGKTDIARHKRRCYICKHPDREAIEEAFLQWRRPGDLRLEFDLPERTCIYRHAHAFGLFEKRAKQLRFALEAIIEEAETVKVTADSVIRAVRAHACLDTEGRWTEPPRRIIIYREAPAAPQPLLPANEKHQLPGPTLPASNQIEAAAREIGG